MTPIEAALKMIDAKVIEVRGDGSVWKLRNLGSTPLAAPRRMETRSKRGYLAVKVFVNGKNYMMSAHRLVWTALRGPMPEGLDINHLDGNKTNNHPDNLEPVTRSQNHLHAYRVLGRPLTKTCPAPILTKIETQAKALRAAGMPYSQIASTLGVSQTTAFRAVRI